MSIVLATGGFDPLHSGHIAYLREARAGGRALVVGVNSDQWLARKKGKPFMPYEERRAIIDALDCVNFVCDFSDDDGTAINAIYECLREFPGETIFFVNGGDREVHNTPEQRHFENNPLVRFIFGVGGGYKKNSSSKILEEWVNPKTIRPWGEYRVLHSDGPGTKVKELVVNPGQSLSMQRHKHRGEHWIVTGGEATVDQLDDNDQLTQTTLSLHQEIHIPAGTWHQLQNNTSYPVKIVEIQYGSNCIEEDIERK